MKVIVNRNDEEYSFRSLNNGEFGIITNPMGYPGIKPGELVYKSGGKIHYINSGEHDNFDNDKINFKVKKLTPGSRIEIII